MNPLESVGYVFSESLGVWSKPDYPGIAYSDGEATEENLHSILRGVTDLSVLSSELRSQCKDWVTTYHLSSQRANVLRPFAEQLKGDVLEIGAGCGAISRFLGENGGQILALEGSLRRASIAASRTRDLDNVTVLAERFDDFHREEQFDAITLIGVLEYASMFSKGSHPAQSMLQKVRRLLRPGGHLFIAIENQLGLKYFAGAPEDHLGQPMYGIEDRYREGQPQTFGREALDELIRASGFSSVQFFAAFPDYKLPRSIVTERGCATAYFDAAALAWQSVNTDPQLPDAPHFDLVRTWPTVFRNRLGMDLANSFVVAASLTETGPVDTQVLGYHYTTERRAEFCKQATFLQTSEESLVVDYQRLAKIQQTPQAPYQFQLPAQSEYLSGSLLSKSFVELLSNPGWSIADLAGEVRQYLDVLRAIIREQKLGEIDLSWSGAMLPGKYIDALPHNIIIGANGTPQLFDVEWVAQQGVEIGFLLCRGLSILMQQVKQLLPPAGYQEISRRSLIEATLQAAGIPLDQDAFDRYQAKERDFVGSIFELPTGLKDIWHSHQLLVAPSELQARAYFCAEGESFNEFDSAHHPLRNGRQRIRLELNARNVNIAKVRFDPIDRPYWFVLHEIILRDQHNQEIWSSSPQQQLESSGMYAVPTHSTSALFYAVHHDPQMTLPVPSPQMFLTLEVDIELLESEAIVARLDTLQQRAFNEESARAAAEGKLAELQQFAEELNMRYLRMANENKAIKMSRTWKLMQRLARVKRIF